MGRASAVLTGASSTVCDVMYSYGFYLGVAFQIADDILDFSSTSAKIGKPVAQDIRNGVLTAPVILSLSGSADLDHRPLACQDELRALLANRLAGGNSDVERAIELVSRGDGLQRAQQLAE